MDRRKIGFLHPGSMGISLAASAKNSGHDVYWVSEGRSDATHKRAESQSLNDAGTLAELCKTVSVIVSICPPHAAEDVAADVASCSFSGLYVDANAISPETARRIGRTLSEVGITFVDGCVIGGPAWERGRTWLYLSGHAAGEVEPYFYKGPLETGVVGDEIGQASALKMCFAAYTKGTTALLSAILATAEGLGVREALENQWSRGGSNFATETQAGVRRVTKKAWRFAGELEEIAATFRYAGLPGGFGEAAAEVYRRMAHFKDAEETPALDEVLAALLEQEG